MHVNTHAHTRHCADRTSARIGSIDYSIISIIDTVNPIAMHGKLIHSLKRQRRDASPPHQSEPLDLVVVKPSAAQHQPAKRARRSASLPAPAAVPADFLTLALQKVFELQVDLACIDAEAAADPAYIQCPNNDGGDGGDDSGNEEEDGGFLGAEAEALGFAICAREALRFLAAQGEQDDGGELVRRLRATLVDKCDGIPI